jgi:glutamyl/glutaminyl-tRNA synthetase
MRTRFAPTPSGFLHRGNIYNILLIFEEAQKNKGEVYLRIDDIDRQRFRLEYLTDIFEKLNLFEHTWIGPKDSEDFLQHFSQQLKLDEYWEKLLHYSAALKLYACLCSRKDLQSTPCSCYEKNNPLKREGMNIKTAALAEHPILWRKEGIALSLSTRYLLPTYL